MGITFDLGQLVLDNEAAGMIKKVVNGIEVNDETLCIDAIKEMGPFKDFLAHRTTFKHVRSLSSPKLFNRQMRAAWESGGGKDAYQRACDEVRHILETYEPPKLSDAVLKEIRSIVDGAEEELGILKGKTSYR